MIILGLFKREHKHKWQTRGVNRWQIPTYRVCLDCGESKKINGRKNGEDVWVTCERIKELDDQFDAFGNYIDPYANRD